MYITIEILKVCFFVLKLRLDRSDQGSRYAAFSLVVDASDSDYTAIIRA